ncbi:MAG: hypothetical protein U5L10_03570 [Candidatus Moranbacteria bacterium]|nr:hypothetical protein [Candidatus Moranbacteria bacterium]
MKIFLDFDDVIFNTKNFKSDFFQLFKNAGVSEKEFQKTYYKKIREGIKKYDLENQLRLLFTESPQKLEKTKKQIEDFLTDLSGYVFEDFYWFVNKVGEEDLSILSFGDEKMQRIKIENSDVSRLAGDYEIVQESKGEYLERKYSDIQAIMVDDRPDQLESADQRLNNWQLIRMNRNEGRYADLPDNGRFKTVKDFYELETLLPID